jgi:phosphopantetheinyl transferase
MALFYQQDINATTKLAIWHIEEEESFFHEKALLQRNITHPHKRLQHLAGRYLLKFLFPDFPNDEMLVADTRKPYLPNEQYHFSISHCGDYAAAIVSTKRRVGIDIEMISERVQNIKEKFLHPEELQFINELETAQTKHLTTFWCAKEAMFKWWGFGEIDFSEVLRLYPAKVEEKGFLPARFDKEGIQIPLHLQYKAWDNLVLSFIETENDIFKMVD